MAKNIVIIANNHREAHSYHQILKGENIIDGNTTVVYAFSPSETSSSVTEVFLVNQNNPEITHAEFKTGSQE